MPENMYIFASGNCLWFHQSSNLYWFLPYGTFSSYECDISPNIKLSSSWKKREQSYLPPPLLILKQISHLSRYFNMSVVWKVQLCTPTYTMNIIYFLTYIFISVQCYMIYAVVALSVNKLWINKLCSQGLSHLMVITLSCPLPKGFWCFKFPVHVHHQKTSSTSFMNLPTSYDCNLVVIALLLTFLWCLF
jgi:hypothetical protein